VSDTTVEPFGPTAAAASLFETQLAPSGSWQPDGLVFLCSSPHQRGEAAVDGTNCGRHESHTPTPWSHSLAITHRTGGAHCTHLSATCSWLSSRWPLLAQCACSRQALGARPVFPLCERGTLRSISDVLRATHPAPFALTHPVPSSAARSRARLTAIDMYATPCFVASQVYCSRSSFRKTWCALHGILRAANSACVLEALTDRSSRPSKVHAFCHRGPAPHFCSMVQCGLGVATATCTVLISLARMAFSVFSVAQTSCDMRHACGVALTAALLVVTREYGEKWGFKDTGDCREQCRHAHTRESNRAPRSIHACLLICALAPS